MTNQEALEEWKQRLRLHDWVIQLDDNLYQLSEPDCSGCTQWSEVGKTARIELINPDAYGARIVPYDPEKTLVHELLHLKFCLLDNSGNELQDRMVHQLIDDLAKAFVDAKRAN